jgi:phage baseplate assembly protein W
LSQSPKDFLGIGWKFPPTLNDNFMLKTSQYEEDIKEAIWIILSTSKGERIMRPDFGCGIHDFVFESISSGLVELIKRSVSEALHLWEPRITLLEISVSTENLNSGLLVIEIKYIVNMTNNSFNLVYPFYLKE